MAKKNSFDNKSIRDHRVSYLATLLSQTREGNAEEIERMLRALDVEMQFAQSLRNRPFVQCEDKSDIDQHVSLSDIDNILWTFDKHLYVHACPELRAFISDDAHLQLHYGGLTEIGEFAFTAHLINEED